MHVEVEEAEAAAAEGSNQSDASRALCDCEATAHDPSADYDDFLELLLLFLGGVVYVCVMILCW